MLSHGLLLALHKPDEARDELNLARKLIVQMGYKRRDPEVLELAGIIDPAI